MILTSFAQHQPVTSGVYQWSTLQVEAQSDRETRNLMEGKSAHLDYLEIHATTQKVGATPRPPHANDDIEEIILVKDGVLKMTIGNQSAVLGAGSVILILPKEMHTLENIGDTPLTYYVIRYRSTKGMNMSKGNLTGGSLMLHADSLEFVTTNKGGRRNYLDRATAMLEKLEIHVTQLDHKGPSHQPHAHDDTEIILALQGDTEMTIDNHEFSGSEGDLYFIESQMMHGIRNAVDSPCRYFAIRWK